MPTYHLGPGLMDDPMRAAPLPTPADRTGEEDIPGARIAALTAYVEVNRERFTEAALRTAAQEAGYTAAEFNAAWPAVGWRRPQDAIPSRTRGVIVAGTIVAFVVATWLLLSIAESLSATTGIPGAGVVWVTIGIVGSIGWFVLRDLHPSVSKGLGCGVLIVAVLPLVIFVAVLGICLVTGSTRFGA